MKSSIVRNSRGYALFWAVFILLLCATPGHYIPSAGWLQLLSADKLVHAGLFFVLAALLIVAAHQRWSHSRLTWLLLLAVLYGFVIEMLQATLFVARSFELYDAVADGAGVLIAALMRKRIVRWAFT